jgi:cytochrome c biogenesis protein CcmG/thiol:disulfide interchange protein DsbE
MTPRLVWTAVAGVAMLAAVVLTIAVAELPKGGGAGQSGSAAQQAARLTPARVRALLAGSPPALAALHAQAGLLLEGGARAWAAQLHALHGLPVVVNKWASWCVPCQGERAVFAQAAAATGRRVAFLGIDSLDSSRGEARQFMRAEPLSYPSFYDKSGALGEAVTDTADTPVTVILSTKGGRYIHQGPYETVGELEHDIAFYGHTAAGA